MLTSQSPSTNRGQRVWNQHAVGGLIGFGTSPCEHDLRAGASFPWIGHGHGGQERTGVRVHRLLVEVVALGELHRVTEVHDHHAVRDVADDVQIVRDEDVGEAELALEVLEQVEDLRLDRDVERRYRLVADDELRD